MSTTIIDSSADLDGNVSLPDAKIHLDIFSSTDYDAQVVAMVNQAAAILHSYSNEFFTEKPIELVTIFEANELTPKGFLIPHKHLVNVPDNFVRYPDGYYAKDVEADADGLYQVGYEAQYPPERPAGHGALKMILKDLYNADEVSETTLTTALAMVETS